MLLVQIVIQLQKFAEAVKRIKGAVGSVNDRTAPPAAAAAAGKSAYSSDSVFGKDLSGLLSTDLTGIDPSLGGQLLSPTGIPCTDCLYHMLLSCSESPAVTTQLFLISSDWSELCRVTPTHRAFQYLQPPG